MDKLWSDALLRREIDLHLLRRASGRNWSYPGPQWMLLATLWFLPLLAAIGFSDGKIVDVSYAIAPTLWWQTWLLCLRASIGCSVSVADEVEKKTVVVLHTTPLGLGRLLLTKLGVCLWPLLVEIYCIAIFYQLLNLAHPWAEWHTLLKLQLLQLAATLLYGCFGLWLGALIGHSERAAASARATVFMTMIGCCLLEKALNWPVLVAGGMIWFCLIVHPHSRPSRAYHGGVVALVLLLFMPLLYTWVAPNLPKILMYEYSPLVAVGQADRLPFISLLYLGIAALFGFLSYRQTLKAL